MQAFHKGSSAAERHVIVRQFGWQQWRILTVIRQQFQKTRHDLCSHKLANL